MQMACCFYPHLIWDGPVAPPPHPQSSPDPPLRHALHPCADEVYGRTGVIADGLVEWTQGCPDLSLHVIIARGSELV